MHLYTPEASSAYLQKIRKYYRRFNNDWDFDYIKEDVLAVTQFFIEEGLGEDIINKIDNSEKYEDLEDNHGNPVYCIVMPDGTEEFYAATKVYPFY
jgi:hypothetical protein